MSSRAPFKCFIGRHTWQVVYRWPIAGTCNASIQYRCCRCGKEAVKLGY